MVFIMNLGYAVGALIASPIADKKGYNFAFTIAGIATVGFAVVYLVICGPGLPDREVTRESPTDVEFSKKAAEKGNET
jgi:hypothetical protein